MAWSYHVPRADADAPGGAALGWMDKCIHPDNCAMVEAAIDAAIESKTPFELEHRVRRLDGSLGWTHSRAVPSLNADGRITEWIGAATDITQRKQTETALEALSAEHARQSRLFVQLASTTPDFIYTFDTAARIRHARKGDPSGHRIQTAHQGRGTLQQSDEG